MSRHSKDIALSPAAEPAAEGLRALLGPPPLLEGEDFAAYTTLHDRIIAAVEPKDALEEIWIRDVVDLLWETLRLRRLKMDLMASAAHQGLDRLLTPLVEWSRRKRLVEGWAIRDRDAVREVKSIIGEAGLDERAIHAQTLSAKLDTFERIDRLIMQAEARRNAALREIDRHRDVLAQRLRDVARDIEDAEFSEIKAHQDAAE